MSEGEERARTPRELARTARLTQLQRGSIEGKRHTPTHTKRERRWEGEEEEE